MRLKHEHPGPLPRLDQPVGAQARDRLAHHGAADPMRLAQLRFAGKLAAGWELAADDRAPQAVAKSRRKRPARLLAVSSAVHPRLLCRRIFLADATLGHCPIADLLTQIQ